MMLNQIMRLERQARRRPGDARAQCELSVACLELGEREKAIEAVEAAAQCAEIPARLAIEIGEQYVTLGFADRARALFVRACAADPESGPAHQRLGAQLYTDGQIDDAATLLAAAVFLAPEDPEARLGLARALVDLKAPNEAETHARVALDLRPSSVEAWTCLALIHDARHAPAEALEALQQAFTLQPKHHETGKRLARQLARFERHAEAASVLRSTASHHPDDPSLLIELGRAQADAGQARTAIQTLLRAIELSPHADRAELQLGILYRQEGLYDEAIELLTGEIERHPEDAEVHYQLGDAYFSNGDLGAAVSVLVRGAMLARDDRRLRRLLAAAQSAQNDRPVTSLAEYHPQMSRLISAVSTQGGETAFSGNLREFNLMDLLEFLRMNRRTGTLRLASSNGLAEICLLEGQTTGASTSNTPRLGEMLVKAGLLDEAQLQAAFRCQMAQDPRPPLGQVLLTEALVEVERIRPVLERQVREALLELLRWPDGIFVFEADAELLESEGLRSLQLDTTALLLDVFRTMDEAAREASLSQ